MRPLNQTGETKMALDSAIRQSTLVDSDYDADTEDDGFSCDRDHRSPFCEHMPHPSPRPTTVKLSSCGHIPYSCSLWDLSQFITWLHNGSNQLRHPSSNLVIPSLPYTTHPIHDQPPHESIRPATPASEQVSMCSSYPYFEKSRKTYVIEEALDFSKKARLLIEAHAPYRVVHANAAHGRTFGDTLCEWTESDTLETAVRRGFGSEPVAVYPVWASGGVFISHFLVELLETDEQPTHVVG